MPFVKPVVPTDGLARIPFHIEIRLIQQRIAKNLTVVADCLVGLDYD